MSTLLYPPNGGEPVLAHATQVDRMKSKGWLEAAQTTGKKAKPTTTKVKDEQHGES
tara:strand:+ start:2821 stop:2988 length:168 start_codon:yes stop_codon:yes gene_type:complete